MKKLFAYSRKISQQRTFQLGLLFGIISASIVFISTSTYGPGISPDSVVYFYGAKSILENGTYTYNGNPIVVFPPFFSFLLASISWLFHLDLELSFRILSFVSMIVYFIAAAYILDHFKKNRLALIPGLIFLMGYPIFISFTYLWSESIFNTLTVIMLLLLLKYFENKESKYLFMLSLISAIAVLTRYAGLFFVAGICLILLIEAKGSLKNKLSIATKYAAFPVTVAASFLLRNYSISGTLTGPRSPLSEFSILRNILTVINDMTKWFIPGGLPPFIESYLGIPEITIPLGFRLFTIIFVVSLCYFFFKKNGSLNDYFSKNNFRKFLTYMMIIFFIYVILLLAISNRIHFGSAHRFLAPIYVITAIIIVFLTDLFLVNSNSRQIAFGLIVLLTLYAPLYSFIGVSFPSYFYGLEGNYKELTAFLKKYAITNISEVKSDHEEIVAYQIEKILGIENNNKKSTSKRIRVVILFDQNSKLNDYADPEKTVSVLKSPFLRGYIVKD